MTLQNAHRNFETDSRKKVLSNTIKSKINGACMPLVYGAIIQLSPDRAIADQILTEMVLLTRNIKTWSLNWKPVCLTLLNYKQQIAMKNRKIQEIQMGQANSESCTHPKTVQISKAHSIKDNEIKSGIPASFDFNKPEPDISNITSKTSLAQFYIYMKAFYAS
jgi:hypothetical protein